MTLTPRRRGFCPQKSYPLRGHAVLPVTHLSPSSSTLLPTPQSLWLLIHPPPDQDSLAKATSRQGSGAWGEAGCRIRPTVSQNGIFMPSLAVT